MNCDKCKWYNWYFDWCSKWNFKVESSSVYGCCEKSKNDLKLTLSSVYGTQVRE